MGEKARVVICGSRGWTDEAAIWGLLTEMDPASAIIVTGAARGADSIAAGMATQLGFQVEQYPADWKRYGHSAGFRRNELMCHLPNVCQVIAFWDGKSRGTGDTIRRARDMGLRVDVHRNLRNEAIMGDKRTPEQENEAAYHEDCDEDDRDLHGCGKEC